MGFDAEARGVSHIERRPGNLLGFATGVGVTPW
jgi:hypothetical protein